MTHNKFCDLRTCRKVYGGASFDSPPESVMDDYIAKFLTPSEVGARKGIFVPRELVNKLAKLVKLYDVEGLTIGAYVTSILVYHLCENRDVINTLTDEGEKTVIL